MNNRWGQALEPKVPSRSSSSNNINININFNNVKEKNNVFGGKKVNNYLQVGNDPKPNIARPNVSMETLKQKKKLVINKDDPNQHIRKKKSKSKIVNDLCTPEKRRNRINEDDKSVNKTNKRTSKSYENLKNFYLKDRNKKSRSKSKSNSNSKYQSRSKSRSKSQSSQKLLKNYSKKKVNYPIKLQTKKQKEKNLQDKNMKKGKKVGKHIDEMKQSVNDLKSKMPKRQKRPSQTKVNKGKKSKRNKSPDKDIKEKSLKRPPLVYEIDEHEFDEESSYKKHDQQARNALYKFRLEKQQQQQLSVVQKHMKGKHTYSELKKLTQIALIIQKYWKGFKVRKQFHQQLQNMAQRIEKKKKIIEQKGRQFWDSSSNSFINANDISQDVSESSKIKHYNSKLSDLSEKRIKEVQPQKQIQTKLNQLQADLEQQKIKANQLQEENRNLKFQLQKASVQQSFNSLEKSPWQQEEERENQSDSGVILKLPKKIKREEEKRQDKSERSEMSQASSEIKQKVKRMRPILKIETDPLNDPIPEIKKIGGQIQFRSPRAFIDESYTKLIRKKQDQIKDSFEKKSNMFNRMLHDKIFSPRTYKVKVDEIQQKFKQQTELVRIRLEEMSRVACFIKQIKEQQKKEDKEPHKQIAIEEPPEIPETKPLVPYKREDQIIIKTNYEQLQKEHHLIEDYPNIVIDSQRKKQQEQANNDLYQSGEFQNSEENEPIEENIRRRANTIFQSLQPSEPQNNQHKPQSPQHQGQQVEVHSEVQVSVEETVPQIERVVGMQTTLHFIKEYCIAFIEYIRNSLDFKEQFFNNITSPIVFDSLQFLKSYRTTQYNENDTTYNSLRKQYIYPFFKINYPKPSIISRESFEEFNENYDKLQGQCNYKIQRQFFLNSILDTFNQALDYERPSSFYGQPPLWMTESRSLKNHSIINLDPILSMDSPRLDEACGVAIARLIQWATSLCGFIPESPQMQNIVIDEQQIQTIRQTRMALMLEKGLVQDEQKMIDMGIEEVEIKLQSTQVIFDCLLEEALKQMKII